MIHPNNDCRSAALGGQPGWLDFSPPDRPRPIAPRLIPTVGGGLDAADRPRR